MRHKRVASLAVVAGIAILLIGCGPGPAASPQGTSALPQAQPTQVSGSVADHLAAGDAALNAEDLVAAEREYKAALALDSRSARAQFGLGNVYVRQEGRLSEAEKAYKAAIELDPTLAAAHTNLGVTYYQMGELSKAANAFQAALKIEPDDAKTLYLMGAVRLQENNLSEAEQHLMRARDLDPQLPEVYYGLGVLYRLKGQKQDAIAAFEKFLAIGPGQDPSALDHARQEIQALKGE